MKKLSLLAFLLFATILLAACGDNDSSSETSGSDDEVSAEESGNNEEEEKDEPESEEDFTAQSVIDSFKEAGLEVGESFEMTKDDYGLAPMKAEEGIRFLIPSMGEDNGGRVFTFNDESELDELKEYYDSLGRESAVFFSWTIKHKNVLVQIGGELPEEDYNNYKSVLEGNYDPSSSPEPEEEKVSEATLETASVGDFVPDDFGTYEITKIVEPNQTYESGPIEFSLNRVLLATFEPNEESASLFDVPTPMNLAITLIESENTSDDTVSFHPFSTKVTTETKGQYEAQVMLNEGDSEHIGNVIQEHITAFNLGEEDLSTLSTIKFIFDPPAIDHMSEGEEVQVDVSFE